MCPLPTKVKYNGKGGTVLFLLPIIHKCTSMDNNILSSSANNSSSQTNVAHITSQPIQHTITLEEFQLIMKKATRLGSLRVVSYMRKEGML